MNEPSGVANIKEGWFQMFSSLALSTLLEHNLGACLKRVRGTASLWANIGGVAESPDIYLCVLSSLDLCG